MPRALVTSAVALSLLAAVSRPAHSAPSVTAAASSGAGALELDGGGSSQMHIVKVADVSASTDGAGGFRLSISAGELHKADSSTPVPFQMALVSDGGAPPAAGAFTTAAGGTLIWITTSAGAAARDLYILYTPAALQDPGAYSASASLSIING
jgi:hypothetical protein